MENKNNADSYRHNKSPEEINTQSQQPQMEVEGNPEEEDNIPEEDEMMKLQNELAIQKDKYIRLVAEFDNFKRRNAKERGELIQTAGKEVITSMLDVLDDSDRAEKQMSTSDDIELIKDGINLVFNKLRNTLQSKGLKAMESIDTDFDVHKHEAIAEVSVEDENKKGKVIDEIVKGYYLNDKLIRFAKVIVGK
jgi:molecular chaperone GrpE